jgi:type II secretory pathway component PulK
MFISSIAMLILERSSNSYMQVIAIQRDNQGAIYSGTALAAVSALMEFDNPDYDSVEDAWNFLPGIPVKDGFAYVQIRAADAKLPINSLANTNEAISERMQAAFTNLFRELGYEDELWKYLKDWVSSSNAEPMSNFVTGTTFNQQGNSYTAKHAPLSSLYEIRLMPQFAEIYRELSQYTTIGETTPRININMADALVIRSFLPELEPFVDTIIEARAENPFKNKDALYGILGPANLEIYTKVLPFFDVKSTLFYVRIEVNILDGIQNYHALMRRSGRRMTVISYIEGGGLDYF